MLGWLVSVHKPCRGYRFVLNRGQSQTLCLCTENTEHSHTALTDWKDSIKNILV